MNWRFIPTAILVTVMLTSFSAEAAFHSRLGGQAYYDDQLDITWATDVNAIGFGTWGSRVATASTLTIDGVSGWRLPDMDVDNNGTVVDCFGISQAECKDNEFDHLYNYGAGTVYSQGISTGGPGPFTNISIFNNWSSTLGPDPNTAYQFNMGNGSFGPLDTSNIYAGWAVHDGDVNPVSIVDVTRDFPFGSAWNHSRLGMLPIVTACAPSVFSA